MKKKIGFLGGTFDPIHLGHIHLAICLKEKCLLDEVWFSPAFLSPFKQKTPPLASAKDRLEMTRLAIEKIEGFFLNESELREEKISYTIDALRNMQKKDLRAEWHLLISEDEVERLEEWRDIEEIQRIAPPRIGGRSGNFSKDSKAGRWKKNLIEMPQMEISSTDVRERLKKGLYCGHLMDAKVLDYIYRNKLYSSFNYK